MAELLDHLKNYHEHAAAVDAHTKAGEAELEAMHAATHNGGPLPDGVYSEEPNPRPVVVKANGIVSVVRPRYLGPANA
jgi:hypothetical protein